MSHRDALITTFLTKNSHINLSAIRDPEGVRIKHIADSLELTKIMDLSKFQTLIDVGTGGGFPLLALALYAQEHGLNLELTGLDARRKKTHAVQSIADELKLNNVQTVRSRAENHDQQYDIVIARAVAHADTLFDRITPLVKQDGYVVLYKEKKTKERAAILQQCKKHRLTLEQEHVYRLFDEDIERVLYVVQNKSI